MNAVILLATLKKSTEVSHTEGLCQLLIEEFKKQSVESEILRLIDFHIPPGVVSDVGEGDEWPKILDKMLKSDIVIFATPIWWSNQSSLMQRVVERLDELNEEIVATGKSEFLNKVAGMVITGAEDGAQHIIGNLGNFLAWNGFSLPPAPSLSYLGSYERGEEDSVETVADKFRKMKNTAGMARTMAKNIVHLAKVLQKNPFPAQEAGAQYLR